MENPVVSDESNVTRNHAKDLEKAFQEAIDRAYRDGAQPSQVMAALTTTMGTIAARIYPTRPDLQDDTIDSMAWYAKAHAKKVS